MRLRAGVRRNFQERIPGGNTYGFRVPETAISNTSNILEDAFLLATVPEPADATWPLETGFRPGTIVLRALEPSGCFGLSEAIRGISAGAVASLCCEFDEARMYVLLGFLRSRGR